MAEGRQYKTFDPIPETVAQSLSHLSPLVRTLLYRRGITNLAEAEEFLNPRYDTQLHDSQLLNDMGKAIDRIEQAMKEGERIAIFSDYDCDGIPGAVVLHDLFKALKYENFQNYIPHRHYEGFGLSIQAIDRLVEAGVKLVITIDCGTSNIEEVAYAKEQGIDIIITDHHEPEAELPAAVAVVNPKLGGYPFPHLCGAAVAFKLAQALLARLEHDLTPGFEKWWLDMVGIATIADMVPLVGENRVFAHYGLQVLRKSRRPGLQQLLKKAKLDQRYLTEEDIGFTIGPRINAASRMDTPEDAFFMLAEKDIARASERVEYLERLNIDRKTQVALITKDLHQRLKKLEDMPAVLVMGHTEWRPSLVGLAANKLAEEYGRPAFLWGTDGNGVYKGSCRSGGSVSVVKLMQAVSHVFIESGGHHASGGFSVKEEHIFTFGEELAGAMAELGDSARVEESIPVDAELRLDDVNELLINELNRLAPYGTGNPKPLFLFKGVTPSAVETFGKAKEHTKLIFNTEYGKLEAIAFFKLPQQFSNEPRVNVPLTLIAHVERSFFLGRSQIRLRIVDIL
ncbi:MAG: single-stranded-DNA-specific exonuclease RecJ [Candidatus Pacebacteria bacterium]|nr:single-stranded-DNA-specific exonuclease RecJ [Candidatus Paceibacterota bacterium]